MRMWDIGIKATLSLRVLSKLAILLRLRFLNAQDNNYHSKHFLQEQRTHSIEGNMGHTSQFESHRIGTDLHCCILWWHRFPKRHWLKTIKLTKAKPRKAINSASKQLNWRKNEKSNEKLRIRVITYSLWLIH